LKLFIDDEGDIAYCIQDPKNKKCYLLKYLNITLDISWDSFEKSWVKETMTPIKVKLTKLEKVIYGITE
jgi:hypothetical protein